MRYCLHDQFLSWKECPATYCAEKLAQKCNKDNEIVMVTLNLLDWEPATRRVVQGTWMQRIEERLQDRAAKLLWLDTGF